MSNLGPASEEQLKARYGSKVTLVFLYALQGALLDLHWNRLPPEVKDEIVAAVRDS